MGNEMIGQQNNFFYINNVENSFIKFASQIYQSIFTFHRPSKFYLS